MSKTNNEKVRNSLLANITGDNSFNFIDFPFWEIEKDFCKIVRIDLIEFLKRNNFYLYKIDDNYIYIRIVDNVVYNTDIKEMKHFTLKYIKSVTNISLKDKKKIESSLLKGIRIYFSEDLLDCLRIKKLEFKRDTKEIAYFYFKNCFVEVSKSGFKIYDYSLLNGYIWNTQIIQHNFTIDDKSNSDFKTFIENISGGGLNQSSLISCIGYLLHDFKNVLNAKAVIFCDNSKLQGANGRSGKSLICKAISFLRSVVRLDGRNFDFNNSFAFQSVSVDTQIIDFNDVKESFNFGFLFSIITDNIEVEKKFKNKVIIPFEYSPKIIISTNYVIKANSISDNDRKIEIGLTNFYNENHKPINDFNKVFFEGWSGDDWNLFFNYMLSNVMYYFNNGIITNTDNIDLIEKKLISNTCQEFLEFLEDLTVNTEYDRKDLYINFVQTYNFKHLTVRKFTDWFKYYCNHYNYEYISKKTNGRYILNMEFENSEIF